MIRSAAEREVCVIRPGPEEGLIFVGICDVAERGDLH